MSDDVKQAGHDPDEIRALLNRLSRDKRAVSAHLAIKVDLEHTSAVEASRVQAARSIYSQQDDK
jgi:hypothetical protein